MSRRPALSLPFLLLAASLHAQAPAASDPDPAFGLPEWLSLDGHVRVRFEALEEQFRAGRSGNDHLFAARSGVRAVARTRHFSGTVEILDARQLGAPDDSPVNTGTVNALDLLQANVTWRGESVDHFQDRRGVTLGRQTFDVGSRRFIARNRFRNTINSFTGLTFHDERADGREYRYFWLHPVHRLPSDRESLLDNDAELDEERSQVRFFGGHKTHPDRWIGLDAEVYAFFLDEDDGDDLETRDRRLATLGGRIVRTPPPGKLDFEAEAAFQFGKSRASRSASDTTDLDHEAYFLHLSAGRRWETPGAPRLELLFDYASGDDDPDDDENNRFDTLYGARRFELGPTGICGAFARSNLISPGARLTFSPGERAQVMIAHRFHYLASDRDAWTTSGLVDPTGESGNELGQMFEIRVRGGLASTPVRFDAGFAHLFAGDFIDDAPNATTQGDTSYGYFGATLTF